MCADDDDDEKDVVAHKRAEQKKKQLFDSAHGRRPVRELPTGIWRALNYPEIECI